MSARRLSDKELTNVKTQFPRASRMRALIEQKFAPEALELIDESDRHSGHSGARAEGESHYRMRIVSAAFEGMGRLARHRAVSEALAGEFASGLHALSLELKTPAEAGAGPS
jgi:BolA family transcriptional regulator, general stress-responsive regulator